MKIITIANQKGGVAKTTTATAIASILQAKGYKTLMIDADVQGNTTDTYGAIYEGVPTLYDVILEDDKTPISDAIQITHSGHIVASDPLLRDADRLLGNDMSKLRDALEDLQGYDFVVIDTAPTMNTLLHNCLVASTNLIIPITASRYSLQGLSQLNETIKAIKKQQNQELQISGLLLTKFSNRTLLARETKESLIDIVEKMDTKLFKTAIRASVKTEEAQALKTPLIEYAPKCTTTQDYIEFVNELLKEI